MHVTCGKLDAWVSIDHEIDSFTYIDHIIDFFFVIFYIIVECTFMTQNSYITKVNALKNP